MVREVGMGGAKDTDQSESWEAYLDAGETLLWQGAPATGIKITGKGVFISIFSLFFLGLWMVFGHWFYDAYKRKRARYALTSKRAIIARSMINRRMESYTINGTSPLSLVEGNLDTVNFAERVYNGKNGTNRVSIGFRYIHDGRTLYNLIQDVKKANT